MDDLWKDQDAQNDQYNESRPCSVKYCYEETPIQTSLDFLSRAKEKILQL